MSYEYGQSYSVQNEAQRNCGQVERLVRFFTFTESNSNSICAFLIASSSETESSLDSSLGEIERFGCFGLFF